MIKLIPGDALEQLRLLPADSVHCCVTSPPYYGLRDYQVDGQIGLEPTPDEYIAALVAVFREVRRVLRPDGTLWVVIGDSYAGGSQTGRDDHGLGRTSRLGPNKDGILGGMPVPRTKVARRDNCKPKDLLGIPWMLAFALRADGWYLRQDIVWSKPNPMPESVTDRCTKAHEYLFLLSRSERYWFDAAAIAEPATNRASGTNRGADGMCLGYDGHRTRANLANGIDAKEQRNKRSVWTIASQAFPESHFATFPPALIEPAILAGCPRGGVVLDCFGGAGTTGLVADRLGRDAILIELNPTYCAMIRKRITNDAPLFVEFANA